MRFIRIISLIALSCAATPSLAAGTDDSSPMAVVQAFMSVHFANDMSFTEPGVNQKKAWLTRDLYDNLLAELHKPANPDEAPAIDGDPFTDTQEFPTAFKVGTAKVAGEQADVPVTFTLQGGDTRTVDILLKHDAGHWLIDDFVYDDRSTLRALLLDSR